MRCGRELRERESEEVKGWLGVVRVGKSYRQRICMEAPPRRKSLKLQARRSCYGKGRARGGSGIRARVER